MKKEDILNIISDFLKEKVNAKLIILFGSFASEKERENSDIDIAFLSNDNLDSLVLFKLKTELEDIVKRDIDLIDLKKTSLVFNSEILSTGKILCFSSEDDKNEYYTRIYSMYANFNEERREILDSIKKRGHIYE